MVYFAELLHIELEEIKDKEVDRFVDLHLPPLCETSNLRRFWLKWNVAKSRPVAVDQAERRPSWEARYMR